MPRTNDCTRRTQVCGTDVKKWSGWTVSQVSSHGGEGHGEADRSALRADRRAGGGARFFEEFRGLGRAEKVRLIREDGNLPLSRECALAGVSRSSLYYAPGRRTRQRWRCSWRTIHSGPRTTKPQPGHRNLPVPAARPSVIGSDVLLAAGG